jgi:outer membrane protein OmpA-like peptidoglycan-associated protein
LSSKKKRAIKLYHKAIENYRNTEYKLAQDLLEQALKLDSQFTEASLGLADLYFKKKEYDKEINIYKKLTETDYSKYPIIIYNYAKCYLNLNEYNNAIHFFNLYIENPKAKKYLQEKAKEGIKKCNNAIKLIKNKLDITPMVLNSNINSEFDEYWPSVNPKGDILSFTRLIVDKNTKEKQEDIYFSKFSNNTFEKAKAYPGEINSNYNEGNQSISSDGKTIYFSSCNKRDGYGRCDIYYSILKDGKWSKAMNIGNNINSGSWEAHPCISADGKKLFFASSRKGGKGGIDIWVSYKLTNKETQEAYWSKPKNLEINTKYDEISPFIHPNNKYLTFSSNRTESIGGFDIFKSELNNNIWTKPENIGIPINSSKDESGFFVNYEGNTAFFNSNKTGNKNIYKLNLTKNLQVESSYWLKGIIRDKITKKKINRSQIICINHKTKDTIFDSGKNKTDADFFISLPEKSNYLINLIKKDYLFFSDIIKIENKEGFLNAKNYNIQLKKLEVGLSVVLSNIFFEHDSYQLLNNSFAELNNIVNFMNLNPSIKIEISGHTDNTGNEKYNLELSKNRALAVCKYISNKGIDKSRLKYKAYGSSKALVKNDSEANKSKNRRTEFKIIHK